MQLVYEGKITGVSYRQDTVQKLFPFWQAASLMCYDDSGTKDDGQPWEGIAVAVCTVMNKAPKDPNPAKRQLGFIPDEEKRRIRAICTAEGVTVSALYGRVRSMGTVQTEKGLMWGVQVEFFLPPISRKAAPNGQE